jgi:hypothetical protein
MYKWEVNMIKILLGGSPCTHWSIAQKNNRETEPKGLGWELFKNYLIAKEKFKPDYFLYENNKSAAQPIKDQISRELGVDLMYINSALVSAQWRERFYAFNWEVEQPTDRKIHLKDVIGIQNDLPTSDKIIMTKSDFKVKVRKHYIDKKELALFLREKKEQARITNKEIAAFCNVPLTLAEHWLRLDGSFSIPDAEIWDNLKQCLHITETIYDKAITEFELKNNVFDMAKCYYDMVAEHIMLTKPHVVGHFDVLNKFSIMPETDERYMEMAINSMKEAAKYCRYFEVNTGGISRGWRKDPYPSDYLLKTLLDIGGEVVINSDSHHPDNLDFYFNESVELLRKVGYDHFSVFNGKDFDKIKI